MGSGMNRAVFTERVTKGLKNWLWKARHPLPNNISTTTTRQPLKLQCPYGTSTSNSHQLALMSPNHTETTEDDNHTHKTAIEATSPSTSSTREITAEEAGTSSDGEISFASSWKKRVSGKNSSKMEEQNDEDDSKALDGDLQLSDWSVMSKYSNPDERKIIPYNRCVYNS